MEHMWSPWRSRHMTHSTTAESVAGDDSGSPDESVFSRIARRDNDEADYVLWRGTHAYVLLNLYPYNNGHLLVVPYRQKSTWLGLSDEERSEMTDLVTRCMAWLTEALHPDGYNVGVNVGQAAGAGIPNHIHMHVVPRWAADTNFMPTTANTRVLPESLAQTWSKLRRVVESTR